MERSALRLGWLGRDAGILVVARGLRAAGMGILVVLIAPYLDKLGFDAPTIGLIFTLSLVGGVVLSLPVTFLGDMIGRKRLFVMLSLTSAVAALALATTDRFALLAVGSFFGAYAATGMNVGPLLQLEQTALAEVSAPSRRTSAFAFLAVVSAAARGLGSLAGVLPALLVVVFGPGEVESFRITFVLYAILNFAASGLYVFLTPAVEARWQDRRRAVNPLKMGSRNRILGLAALFGVDSLAGGMVADVFISFWLVKRFDIGVEVIGPVFVAAQALNAVSLWGATKLAGRIGLLNTMVWTQVIANGLLAAFAFAPFGWLAITVWLGRAFFNEMDVPTRQSYAMAVVSSEERMAMAGATNVGRAGMRVPSPAITGALWAASVNAAPFVIATAAKLAYNFALWRAFRGIIPPEEVTRRRPRAPSGQTKR